MQSYLINTIATYIIIILLIAIFRPKYILNNKLSFPVIATMISICIFFIYFYSNMMSTYGNRLTL